MTATSSANNKEQAHFVSAHSNLPTCRELQHSQTFRWTAKNHLNLIMETISTSTTESSSFLSLGNREELATRANSSQEKRKMEKEVGRNHLGYHHRQNHNHQHGQPHLHLCSLIFLLSLTLATLLTSTSAGTSFSSSSSTSSSSSSVSPSSLLTSSTSSGTVARYPLPVTKTPSSAVKDEQIAKLRLLLPRAPMMAMLAGSGRNPIKWASRKQKRSTATTNDLMQRRFLNARLRSARLAAAAKQKISEPKVEKVLEDAALLQQLMMILPSEQKINAQARVNDWRSLLRFITADTGDAPLIATSSESMQLTDTDNDKEDKNEEVLEGKQIGMVKNEDAPETTSTSFDRPRRRLVINSSSGAKLYVDPRRGIDWPSDEEAIERGLRLPDSHPRRAPRPQTPNSKNKGVSGYNRAGSGQPSSYYYHRAPWSGTDETFLTTTTTTTPRPIYVKPGNIRGTSGGKNRTFNRTASSSVFGGENRQSSVVKENGRRFADRYYDTQQQKPQFGHRYYGGNVSPSTTTLPTMLNPVRNSSRGESGRNRGGSGNVRNRNQLAHLYQTNRTAWEIENRKYQEFVADALQKGHVYGKVSRTNRAAGGGGGDKPYDVPQVGK